MLSPPELLSQTTPGGHGRERRGLPVYVLRANTVTQMEACLSDSLSWRSGPQNRGQSARDRDGHRQVKAGGRRSGPRTPERLRPPPTARDGPRGQSGLRVAGQGSRPLGADLRESERLVFITFEGPEGSGKTTQIRLLQRACATGAPGRAHPRAGRHRYRRPDPGCAPRPVTTRRWTPERRSCSIPLPRPARGRVIRPALASGEVVISDRFADSTWPTGVRARPELEVLRAITEFATGGLNRPHDLSRPDTRGGTSASPPVVESGTG